MRKVRNKEATERKEKENRSERRRRENPCSCTDKAAMLFSCSSLDSQTALLSWSHTAMNAPSTLLREAEETCECERESEKHEHICVFLCKKKEYLRATARAGVCVCLPGGIFHKGGLVSLTGSQKSWIFFLKGFPFEL